MSHDGVDHERLWTTMRAFAFTIGFLLLCAFDGPAAKAAEARETALAQRVEALRSASAPSLLGQPIAAPEMLADFYASRNFRPAWTERAQVAALLQAVEESVLDGLRPGDFHVAEVRRLQADPGYAAAPPEAEAERDILLTDALARLLYQLHYGKVDPRRLDPNWNVGRPALAGNVLEILEEALEGDDVAGMIERARPSDPAYLDLRRGLARYRAIEAAGGWRQLPPGPLLRPGMTDPAIPILRERLMATGDLRDVPNGAADRFDGTLEEGVRRFQARHGLDVDGLIGPSTRAALNVPVRQRIDQLRVNLERARWVLRLAHDDVIDVDIAGFSVERLRDGKPVWQSPAIVGQPFRQTPVFADEIEYLVFNPTWTVPRSILVKDIIPRIEANPDYLAEQGFDVLDGQGQHVPLEQATEAVLEGAAFPWTLVQRPGPLNALGQVKFMFPNEFAVYLHDTPTRDLFGRAARSFSSGCIRVQDARGLAELLLERNPGWDRARIEAAIASGETRTVFLQRRMPVRLLYRTADVMADGTILFREDIYRRDGPLLAALDQPFRPVFPAAVPTPVSQADERTRIDG
jgi:L,D-transpeptidase YcbB